MKFCLRIANSLLLLAAWIMVAASWGTYRLPAAEGKSPTAADLSMAARARQILQHYCHRCHGVERQTPGLDVLDITSLTRATADGQLPFVTPGVPEKSRLLLKMTGKAAGDRMPPPDEPQPTQEEQQVIRDWIAAGAISAQADRTLRPNRGENEIIALIAGDLNSLPADVQPFTRYFSLLHLWNDREWSDDDLRLARAAVSKLLNSLSNQPQIKRPRIVGSTSELLLAIDLRDYGWDVRLNGADSWSVLLAEYPYGLQINSATAAEVYRATGVTQPFVRGDWFVFHASRPPLYHRLLRFPAHQTLLEQSLGIDFTSNFAANKLQRAAFRQSGVSRNNRVVQRQSIDASRSYWNSYDFAGNQGIKDAFARPLGPPSDNSSEEFEFVHDGGEMIFHLPNLLHAYFLTDADGRLISEGPANVVSDPQQFAGSPFVVNGISCFGCHKQGYRDVEDTLRATFRNDVSATGNKVRALYPEPSELKKLLEQDRQHYLRALEEATLPLLQVDETDRRPTSKFPEPITHVAARYGRRLDFAKVCGELFLPERPLPPPPRIPTLAQFKTELTEQEIFRVLGLTPLATGEIVDRTVWESIFLVTARRLELGTPQLLGGPKFISNSIDMKLVWIPAGKGRLGSPAEEEGRDFDESVREVNFERGFYLGMLEVTQDEYLRVTGRLPSFFSNEGARRELVKGVTTGRLPVEKVSGLDAKAFCRQLSNLPAEVAAGRRYRLPSSDEWEYACRAGSSTSFHSSATLNRLQARFDDSQRPRLRYPAICGSFKPNAFGLFDMHGNVAEWCADTRPIAGTDLTEMMFRGGSWASAAIDCRSACRQYAPSESVTETIGFRVVCEWMPPAK